jgi:hypothetical protein
MRASAAVGRGCATEQYVYADRVCTAYAVCGNPFFRWKENGYVIHKDNWAQINQRILLKKVNSVAFSPQANYTDRAAAAC